MKNVLIHVRKKELLNNYKEYFRSNCNYENIPQELSLEVILLIKAFYRCNWNVYLTSIDNFDFAKEEWNQIICINS